MGVSDNRKLQQLALGHVASGHLLAVDVIDLAADIVELRTMKMVTLLSAALDERRATKAVDDLRREFNTSHGKHTMTVGWVWHHRATPARYRMVAALIAGGGTPQFRSVFNSV